MLAGNDDTDQGTDDQSLLNKTNKPSTQDQHYRKDSFAIQNDPRYFISHEKCGGCCRGYMRQDWDTLDLEDGLEEKKADWIELFFDLIFVACIVHISYEAMDSIPSIQTNTEHTSHMVTHRRLSDSLAEPYCEENQGGYDFLLCCFAQFALLTIFWTEQTMMETHFVLNQITDYLSRLCFMSFVLCLGIFIKDNPWHQMAFQLSYIGLKCICIVIYIKVSMISTAKVHAIYHIMQCSIVIIALIFVASFYRGCAIYYFVIYSMLFVFEYVSIILEWTIVDKETGQLRFALPIHIGHISERFGLFIMLILGESIISILAVAELSADDQASDVVSDVTFILLTFFMTFMIATLYYDSQPSEEEIMHSADSHALKTNNKFSRLLYLFGHQLLFFGLLAMGIGIKIAGHHLFDEFICREWIDILLPSYGLVIIVISLFVIRATHPYKLKQKIIWLLRGVILIIMCIMPIFARQINQAIIFFVMFIAILLLVIIDVEGQAKRIKTKKELKEKRHHAKELSDEQIARHQLEHQELQQLSDK